MGLFGPPNADELYRKNDIPGLIQLLSYKKDFHVRQKAACLLGKLNDPRIVEPLMAAAHDPETDVQRAAVQALVEINDPCTFDFFSRLLQGPRNYPLQLAAMEFLKKTGPRAIGPLVEYVAKNNVSTDELSDRAILILKALGWVPDQSAAGAYYWIRHGQWTKVTEIGSPAFSVVLYYAKVGNDTDRPMAVKTLGAMKDPQAAQYIIKNINDKRFGHLYIEALGENPDPDSATLDLVLSLYQKEDTQRSAATALRKIGAAAVPALLSILASGPQVLTEDVYPEMWKARLTVETLGYIGDKRAAEPVLRVMFSRSKGRWQQVDYLFGPLFEDYLTCILNAVQGYETHEEVESIPGNTSGDALWTYTYDLLAMDAAVDFLSQQRSPLAINILHLIAERNDLMVLKQKGSLPGRGGVIIEPLDFSKQRSLAQAALAGLGNPVYDPEAYLKPQAWKIS